MNKSVLEKRIKERAEEKTKEEYNEFVNMLEKNKFGKLLHVKFEDNESIPLSNFGCNYSLFNHNCLENSNVVHTNLEEIYNDILEKNIREETDRILSKLDGIGYLFGQL